MGCKTNSWTLKGKSQLCLEVCLVLSRAVLRHLDPEQYILYVPTPHLFENIHSLRKNTKISMIPRCDKETIASVSLAHLGNRTLSTSTAQRLCCLTKWSWLGQTMQHKQTVQGMSKHDFIYKLSLFFSKCCLSEQQWGREAEQAAGFQIYELQCSQVETQSLTSRDLLPKIWFLLKLRQRSDWTGSWKIY